MLVVGTRGMATYRKSVMPAQAGIYSPADMDCRLRGNVVWQYFFLSKIYSAQDVCFRRV